VSIARCGFSALYWLARDAGAQEKGGEMKWE